MKHTTPPTTAPATISAEQLAGLTNLTKRRLYQLSDESKIPPAIDGKWPMLATITALFSFYQRDGESLQREKMLKTSAERQLREHELGKAKKELISVEVAGAMAGGAMRELGDLWRHRIESAMIEAFEQRATELGVAPHIVTALKGWLTTEHQKFTDSIESIAEARADEYRKELQLELNKPTA